MARFAAIASVIALAAAGTALWMQRNTNAALRSLESRADEARAAARAAADEQTAAQTRLLLLQAPEVAYEWSSGFGAAFVQSLRKPPDRDATFSGTLTIHNRGTRALSAVEVTGCFGLNAELVAVPFASVTGICSLKYRTDSLAAGGPLALEVFKDAASNGIDLAGLLASADEARWQAALDRARHSHQKFAPTLSPPDAEAHSIPLWSGRGLHPAAVYGRILLSYRVNGLQFQHLLTLVTGVVRDDAGQVVQLVDRVMKQPLSRIDLQRYQPLFVELQQAVDNHDAALTAQLRDAGLRYTVKTVTDAEGHSFETGAIAPLASAGAQSISPQ